MSGKTAKQEKHVCDVCQKTFSCRGNLDRHMACHDGSVHLECSTCNKIFHRKDLFKQHMRTHTDERPHECETCGKRFFIRQKLTRHMLIHGTTKPYSCEICGKRSVDPYDLKKHIFIHAKKGYSVEEISSAIDNIMSKKNASKGKSSKNAKSVDKKVLEKIESKMTCTVCGKNFWQNYKLVAHMSTHTQEKPYMCGICGKQFIFKSKLNRHMLTHTVRKGLACKFCSTTTLDADAMRMHLLRHQEKGYGSEKIEAAINELKKERSVVNDKPFTNIITTLDADVQGKVKAKIDYSNIPSRDAPTINIVGDRGIGILTETITAVEQGTSKSLKQGENAHLDCSICGKTYTRNYLAIHMRTHKPERDFVCETCGKSFLEKAKLSRHMLRHSELKPFSCEICEKTSSDPYEMKMHILRHTGKGPSAVSIQSAFGALERQKWGIEGAAFRALTNNDKGQIKTGSFQSEGANDKNNDEEHVNKVNENSSEMRVGKRHKSGGKQDQVSKGVIKDCYVPLRRLSSSELKPGAGEATAANLKGKGDNCDQADHCQLGHSCPPFLSDNISNGSVKRANRFRGQYNEDAENTASDECSDRDNTKVDDTETSTEEVRTALNSKVAVKDCYVHVRRLSLSKLRECSKQYIETAVNRENNGCSDGAEQSDDDAEDVQTLFEEVNTTICSLNSPSTDCHTRKLEVPIKTKNTKLVEAANENPASSDRSDTVQCVHHREKQQESSVRCVHHKEKDQECVDNSGILNETNKNRHIDNTEEKSNKLGGWLNFCLDTAPDCTDLDGENAEDTVALDAPDVPDKTESSQKTVLTAGNEVSIANEMDNHADERKSNIDMPLFSQLSDEEDNISESYFATALDLNTPEERNDGDQAPEKRHDRNEAPKKMHRKKKKKKKTNRNADPNIERMKTLRTRSLQSSGIYNVDDAGEDEEIRDNDVNVKKKRREYWGKHKCQVCGKGFCFKTGLQRHRAAMLKKKHVKHTSTYDENELLALEEIIKSRREARQKKGEDIIKRPKKVYECDACGRRCQHLGQLRCHRAAMLLKGDEKHTSTYDENEIIALNEVNLKQRMAKQKRRSSVKPPKTHICHICGKAYRKTSQLNTHIKTHASEKPVLCTICGKSFWYESSLLKHLKKHDEDFPYQCEKCGEIFKSEDGMQYHVKSSVCDKIVYQTGPVPCSEEAITSEIDNLVLGPVDSKFECTICSKRFETKAWLLGHLHFHKIKTKRKAKAKAALEDGEEDTEEAIQEKEDGKKLGKSQYKCEECGKVLLGRTNLRYHMLHHTNEKPYSCKVCSKTFRKLTTAKYHVTMHLAKKTVPCPLCPLLFRNKESMKRHEYKHNREKPVKCKICSKMLKHEYCLPQHMRFVHRMSGYK